MIKYPLNVIAQKKNFPPFLLAFLFKKINLKKASVSRLFHYSAIKIVPSSYTNF